MQQLIQQAKSEPRRPRDLDPIAGEVVPDRLESRTNTRGCRPDLPETAAHSP